MLGKIPASRLYAPGMALLNMYPDDAELRADASVRLQRPSDLQPDPQDAEVPAGRARGLPGHVDAARGVQVQRAQPELRPADAIRRGRRAGFNHADPRPDRLVGQPEALDHDDVGVGQLQPRVEDVPGGALGEDAELLCLGLHGGAVESVQRRAAGDSRHLHHQPGHQSRLLDGRGAGGRWWRRSTWTAGSSCRSRSRSARGRRARSAPLPIPGGST